LHQHERRQREAIEEQHRVETLQEDNKKLQQELRRCITEMQSARKEHEEELATSKYLVELLQSDREAAARATSCVN